MATRGLGMVPEHRNRDNPCTSPLSLPSPRDRQTTTAKSPNPPRIPQIRDRQRNPPSPCQNWGLAKFGYKIGDRQKWISNPPSYAPKMSRQNSRRWLSRVPRSSWGQANYGPRERAASVPRTGNQGGPPGPVEGSGADGGRRLSCGLRRPFGWRFGAWDYAGNLQ